MSVTLRELLFALPLHLPGNLYMRGDRIVFDASGGPYICVRTSDGQLIPANTQTQRLFTPQTES